MMSEAVRSTSRVVLLTHDSPFGRHMARRVAETGMLDAILVFPQPKPVRPPLSSRVLRRAVAITGLRKIIRRLRRLLGKDEVGESEIASIEARMKADADAWFLAEMGDQEEWPSRTDIRYTSNANAKETAIWLKDRAPDLLAVAGGPILRQPILAVPRLGAVNLHSSLLPDYRGTFSEFWQVHNGDMNKVGITIHWIEAGVDTGDILFQHRITPEPAEDPWRLRVRNQFAGLAHFPHAILEVLAGNVEGRPQLAAKPAYKANDMTLEARRRMLERIGAI